MRLDEIAPPSYNSQLEKAIDQVASIAHLVNYKSGLLRGSSDKGPLTQLRIRQDRQPLDSPMAASVLFNYWIEQKFGIPNIRFRAMYATTSYNDASEYANGAVYIVLPTHDATVVYHPEMSDSLQFLRDISRSLYQVSGIISTIELFSTDSASVSFQKIMDELEPEEIEAFKKLISSPPPQMNGYVAGKAGDLISPPSGGKGHPHPEVMIVDVNAVWAFNAELLHEWDPEIAGNHYSNAFVHMVDQTLEKQQ